ncbi:pyridoxamine 5'-phosphate oxidase family protein [Chitinimonas naiadis]
MRLEQLRDCFEGGAPSMLATCSADGVPNVTYVSQVHFVDGEHVALSFQFFNKTHENILAHPYATLLVLNPATAARYRLTLHYVRTESEGPLFQSMKAKLASIASHTGMAGVFRLLGSDVYRVTAIETVPGTVLPAPAATYNRLNAVRVLAQRLSCVDDLAVAFDVVLAALTELLDIHHALVLCVDESGYWLYTVASLGYAQSGLGSEVAIGDGVVGIAAQYRTPIRLGWPAAEYAYGRAVRAEAVRDGLVALDTEIPFPASGEPHSQLAVPIEAGGWLAGVLYVESPHERRFSYEDEDALVAVAQLLGQTMRWLTRPPELPMPPLPVEQAVPPAGKTVLVRYFGATQSLFLDDDYLIKGVAGAVLWLLLNDYVADGRTDWSNRALRLEPRLRLPELDDNLETRLLLLQRRLQERCDWLTLHKVGRGRLRLSVARPVKLLDVEAA